MNQSAAKTNQLVRLIYRLLALGVWGGAYVVILIHWTTGSGSTIAQSLASGLIAVGSLAGLTGAFLALTQFMLQSRLPVLEQAFGRATLVRIHRTNGHAVIYALLTHATLVTLGYALANHVNVVVQDINFLTSFPYVLWAMLALTLFTLVVVASITIVRRRLKYESWYYVHLMAYLAIVLAFFHQMVVGIDFSGDSAAWLRAFWWGMYIFVGVSLIGYRFLRPIYRSLRNNFRVERVVPEAANIYSIYITGRHLNRLYYQSGQFMIWRFLDKQRFWQAHPFTISQAANGKELRLTFKVVGDFTRELPSIKPGTPVLIDGPYGDFTLVEETNPKLLFIAGGIGLTPLRSMLETMPETADAVLIYAARMAGDIALSDELKAIAKTHRLKIIYLLSDQTLKGYEHGQIDAATIKRLVPNYKERTAYLCGPPPMMASVTSMLVENGVPSRNVKSERFAF